MIKHVFLFLLSFSLISSNIFAISSSLTDCHYRAVRTQNSSRFSSSEAIVARIISFRQTISSAKVLSLGNLYQGFESQRREHEWAIFSQNLSQNTPWKLLYAPFVVGFIVAIREYLYYPKYSVRFQMIPLKTDVRSFQLGPSRRLIPMMYFFSFMSYLALFQGSFRGQFFITFIFLCVVLLSLSHGYVIPFCVKEIINAIDQPDKLLSLIEEELQLLGKNPTEIKIKAIQYRWRLSSNDLEEEVVLWLKEPRLLRWFGPLFLKPVYIVPMPGNWTKLRDVLRSKILSLVGISRPIIPVPATERVPTEFFSAA